VLVGTVGGGVRVMMGSFSMEVALLQYYRSRYIPRNNQRFP